MVLETLMLSADHANQAGNRSNRNKDMQSDTKGEKVESVWQRKASCWHH